MFIIILIEIANKIKYFYFILYESNLALLCWLFHLYWSSHASVPALKPSSQTVRSDRNRNSDPEAPS